MHARHRRTLRGTTAAAIATWIAAVSHTLGGGVFPAPLLLVVVTSLAAPLAVALAGRRLGLARLALTVIATQLLLHVAFASTAGLDPAGATGHVHGGSLGLTGGFASLVPDPGMTVAHLLAAVVTIAVLFRGERVLETIARGLRAAVARIAEPTTVPERPQIVVASTPAAARRAHFAVVVSRRGPPSFVATAL